MKVMKLNATKIAHTFELNSIFMNRMTELMQVASIISTCNSNSASTVRKTNSFILITFKSNFRKRKAQHDGINIDGIHETDEVHDNCETSGHQVQNKT